MFRRGDGAELNVVIDVLRSREVVRRRLVEAQDADIPLAMSCLAFEEVQFGAHRQPSARRGEEALRNALEGVDIIPFEISDAEFAAAARSKMAARGLKAPHTDFLIGAHALARGQTLVTANTRDFQNIPGLQLIDWTRPPISQDRSHA